MPRAKRRKPAAKIAATSRMGASDGPSTPSGGKSRLGAITPTFGAVPLGGVGFLACGIIGQRPGRLALGLGPGEPSLVFEDRRTLLELLPSGRVE
jgi:hypothetical protein